MRSKWLCTAAAAAAFATLAAPGIAAAETAQQVISGLQAKGYTVNIDRIGTGPISDCVVTNIRNPQTITQLLPYRGLGGGRHGDSYLVPTIVSQSISVTLNCTN